jgi:hypothetical protein
MHTSPSEPYEYCCEDPVKGKAVDYIALRNIDKNTRGV